MTVAKARLTDNITGAYFPGSKKIILAPNPKARTVAHEVGHYVARHIVVSLGEEIGGTVQQATYDAFKNFKKGRAKSRNVYLYSAEVGLRNYSAEDHGQFFADFYSGMTVGSKSTKAKLRKNFPKLAALFEEHIL